MTQQQRTAATEPPPAWLDALAYWLDERFRIPGTSWRIGLDGIVGLIPGIGDAASGLVSLFILLQARRLNIRKAALLRIALYVALDFLGGTVPLVGDLFDMTYKSNRKSLRLLRSELDKQSRA